MFTGYLFVGNGGEDREREGAADLIPIPMPINSIYNSWKTWYSRGAVCAHLYISNS